MKHTHRGTCQICGSVQAVNNKTGLLANHGYTTQWGFFSGTCKGSYNLPFEVSKGMIDEAVRNALENADLEDDKAAELRDRTGIEGFWTYYVPAKYQYGRKVPSKHITVPATFIYEQVTEDYKAIRAQYKMVGSDVVITTERGNTPLYGINTIEEAAKYTCERKAKTHDKQAAQLREYASWMKTRIRNWSPTNLIEVAA